PRATGPCWKTAYCAPPEPRALGGRNFWGCPVSVRYFVKKISPKFSVMMTAVVLAAMLGAVLLAAVYRENGSQAILLPDQVMTLFPAPKPLAAFAFTDHENRVFDLSRLKGKWSVLFFGYTHSPDICLIALPTLARAHG